MRFKNVLLLITPASPGRFNGIARYAKEHGWHLTVADRLTHPLTGWTGDGALVTLRDDDAVLRQVRVLRRRGIPLVDLSCSRPEIRLPRVAGDNAAIGDLAARHFRERNYRNTAWYSSSWGHQHALRYGSFATAVTQRWVWTEESPRGKPDDWKSLSRWLGRKLTAASKPIGVLCYDDSDASRVESIALENGLSIPDDVAILGIGDDEPLCEAQAIPLSSVRHDLSRNGFEGAKLLDSLMEAGGNGMPDAENERTILIPPTGIADRASTDALASENPLVRRALGVYLGNLANPPSTEMLAERLGVSRATLDRAFASDMGNSPAHILRHLRISEAKRLLKHSAASASAISSRLGFCNPSYFTNAFRDVTGLSPAKFREAATSSCAR